MIKNKIFIYFIFLIAVVPSAMSQCPERTTVITVLNNLSEIEDPEEAINGLNKLALQCRRCGINDDSTYAKVLHVLGRNLLIAGRVDSAILVSKQSIQVNSMKSPKVNPANRCHSYYNIGRIYSDMGDLKLAEKYLNQAILIGLKYPDKYASVASTYVRRAEMYTFTGDYEKTVLASDQGYKYAQLANDHILMAENLMEKAQALIALNRLKEAEKTIKSALGLSEGDFGLEASLYSLLADLKKKENNPGEVISYYKKSLATYQKDQFDYGCAQAANNLGDFYEHHLNDLANAFKYYETALKFVDGDQGSATILSNISNIRRKSGKYTEAVKYSQVALTALLREFHSLNPQTNPPASTIKNTVDKRSMLSIVTSKADTWLAYAKHTGNDKNKLRNALQTYMLADTMIDYMRWEHSGNVTKLFWREQTRSMYEHAIETCYLLNDHTKAFHFFEKSRAVMLNDQLNELGAKQLLSAEDQKKESVLSRKVSDLQNKLAEAGEDEKAIADIRARLFLAQQKQENFIRKLETSNAQYYAYKYDNAVPTLTELKKRILAEQQTLISYFVGDSAVYGLATGAGKTGFKKIDLKKYSLITTQFQKIIGDREAQNRRFKDYLVLSAELYELLLKPFAIPSGTRIVVSPDGNFLPFGAFSASRDRADYLVSRYAFSYTYSAGFLAKSLKNRKWEVFSKPFLGIAPVQFAPGLAQADLPGSDQALKTINQHFFLSKTLTGPDASRHAFAKEAPDYRIVQLFTHATADSSGGTPTLYFADSTLKVNELLTDRKSSTALLVLSACRTGIGKNQRGEGVFSLARGFASLGIPSTVTTLWDVENEAVYGLTSLFYHELTSELPLDIALQRAQNQWLNEATSAEQLPYAWAGMVLVGSTEHVSPGISRSEGFVLLIASIVLAVFLIYHFRKRLTRNQ